jgi:phosphoglycolate phosphatase
MTVRLCILDCDGTLVDSYHGITSVMAETFSRHGLPVPAPEAVVRLIGLPLKAAIAALLNGAERGVLDAATETYRAIYGQRRREKSLLEPLYPGIVEALDALAGDGWLLALATGKSRAGALATLDAHRLTDRFFCIQTADTAAGKPAPDMILNIIAETGADPRATAMIGDTSFDMLMAGNAGVAGIGVAWGYHRESELWSAGAVAVLQAATDLVPTVSKVIAER